MSSILITGGCGFLGWNIAKELTQIYSLAEELFMK